MACDKGPEPHSDSLGVEFMTWMKSTPVYKMIQSDKIYIYGHVLSCVVLSCVGCRGLRLERLCTPSVLLPSVWEWVNKTVNCKALKKRCIRGLPIKHSSSCLLQGCKFKKGSDIDLDLVFVYYVIYVNRSYSVCQTY